MYQIVINDKYYVSDIDIGEIWTDGTYYITSFGTINNKYEAKLFESKNMAKDIAKQIGGKVIEYIDKQYLEHYLEEVFKDELEKDKKSI